MRVSVCVCVCVCVCEGEREREKERGTFALFQTFSLFKNSLNFFCSFSGKEQSI
jgi:hypothetical protein